MRHNLKICELIIDSFEEKRIHPIIQFVMSLFFMRYILACCLFFQRVPHDITSLSGKYTKFEKSSSLKLIPFFEQNDAKNHFNFFGQKMRLTLRNVTLQTLCIFRTGYDITSGVLLAFMPTLK